MNRKTVFLFVIVAIIASMFVVSAALSQDEVSGDLMIYTSTSENFISLLVEKFNAKYPNAHADGRENDEQHPC